ncbi:hypothetical protein E5K89_03375 [Helicobacter pylori]|nr:hypothetical protein [Helicobacter pylori]KOO66015.1 hypothetical protein AK968_07345 [Helicobacter pylori]OJZ94804.1 hypothetical protein AP069_0202010 [Helicobacter pylori]OKB28708.1 hypothetical protein AP070_0203570 [Helicobacter pylori]WRC83559.1 hypothetical protein E5K89_03375 [Helicobacter pylori]
MLNQDVLLNSHEAGVGGLEGEILNGFVSFIKSIYECQKKGKDPKEAIKHTANKTLENGAYSYGIASGGSLLGDMMQNNANQVIQSFGKSSLPVMIVGVAVTNVTIFIRYFSGKIDKAELCKQLGRTNTSLLSGGHYALAGQALIPIPVVGALHWGLCGCSVERSFFNALNSKKVELACQKRIEIEKECRESIRLLEMHQNQFNEVFERYFHGTIKFFNESFDELERALYAGDADLVIGANNKIQEGLGQKALSNNK